MIFYIFLEIHRIFKIIIVRIIADNDIGISYNILEETESLLSIEWVFSFLFGPVFAITI